MKALRNILFLFLLITAGCSGDDEKNMSFLDLGIINHYGNGYLIITDAGVNLQALTLPVELDFDDNLRVSVKYRVIRPAEPNDSIKVDYIVDVEDINELLTKEIITINDANRDTLGSSPVKFENVWITQDYLTVYFSFYAGTKDHYFNLTYDPMEQTSDDFVALTFRHKDNGDTEIKQYWGYVSFRLNSLRREDGVPVNIHFRGKQFDEMDFQLNDLVYTY